MGGCFNSLSEGSLCNVLVKDAVPLPAPLIEVVKNYLIIKKAATIWYLTKKTGSATVLSIATILGMLPMVILSPFVGPMVDRWNKKGLLIFPDVFAACFAIILSVSGTVFHVFPLWLIFISLLMWSCAQTFQMPTIQSVMPTMVPDKEITRMNGQLGMVQSVNMIIAPALGAFLFAFIPIEYLILLDVLGAIIGICILTWVQIPNNEKIDQPMHVLHNTRLGIKQLTNNKGLWYITLIGAVFTLTYMPAASMYPLMTMKYFQGTVSQAGLIEAIYSTGMLIGGTIIGLFGKWQDRMKPVIIAFFLVGIPTGISGILPGNQTGFLWFAALNIIEGIATPFFYNAFNGNDSTKLSSRRVRADSRRFEFFVESSWTNWLNFCRSPS